MTPPPAVPGDRIELEGMLNLRDLGGWAASNGATRWGRVFRSDRLNELTSVDHDRLNQLGITTVIDLRSDQEVEEDQSRLWSGVESHLRFPIGGDSAQQKSFIERILDGEVDAITDEWVGEAYIEMLTNYPTMFGQAIISAVAGPPALFHCTAGKDRTGLVAMFLLSTNGVSDQDVLTDFTLSNRYRAETRMVQLAPMFAEKGLDVEDFRAALSAPGPAMTSTMAWLRQEFGSVEGYLLSNAGLSQDDLAQVRAALAS